MRVDLRGTGELRDREGMKNNEIIMIIVVLIK